MGQDRALATQTDCLEADAVAVLSKLLGVEASQAKIAQAFIRRQMTVVLPQPGGPVRSTFLH
jgi:hypothetical protein